MSKLWLIFSSLLFSGLIGAFLYAFVSTNVFMDPYEKTAVKKFNLQKKIEKAKKKSRLQKIKQISKKNPNIRRARIATDRTRTLEARVAAIQAVDWDISQSEEERDLVGKLLRKLATDAREPVAIKFQALEKVKASWEEIDALGYVGHSMRELRNGAILFIGKLGRQEHVDQLLEILDNHEDETTREAAVKALETIGGPNVEKALIERLTNASVSNAIIDSLKSLTGQDFGADTADWRKWFQANRVPAAS